jgi:hypothetical protein
VAAMSVGAAVREAAHCNMSMPPLTHLTVVLLRRIQSTMMVTRRVEDDRVSEALPEVGAHYDGGSPAVLLEAERSYDLTPT